MVRKSPPHRNRLDRARSSVGARSLHTRAVAGSSPAVPMCPFGLQGEFLPACPRPTLARLPPWPGAWPRRAPNMAPRRTNSATFERASATFPHLRSRPAGEFTIDNDRQVPPRRRLWIQIEAPMNPADHQVELSVIDAVYEDHARVLTPGGGPFAEDRGEVAHVVGDEDPFLGRRQGQHVVVVAAPPAPAADPALGPRARPPSVAVQHADRRRARRAGPAPRMSSATRLLQERVQAG